MKIFSQDLLTSVLSTKAITVRFTVNGFYVDENNRQQTDGVVVTLTADGYTQTNNYIDVPIGTTVAYTVAKEGYNTIGPKSIAIAGDTTLDVEVSALPMWTYTIHPTPADATVTMSAGSSYQSVTGSIQVPEGSSVTWDIGRANMQSLHGVRVIPADSSESDPVVEYKELSAILTLAGTTPANAQVSWNVGVGDVRTGMSVEALVSHSVTLTVSYPGYQTYTQTYPIAPDVYLTNQTLPAVTLTPTAATCTLSATPNDATISMRVNSGAVQTGTGSKTVDCIIGDIITWSVTRSGYQIKSGTHTITANDSGFPNVILPSVVLSSTSKAVTITSVPNTATIEIYQNGVLIDSGIGIVETEVDYGSVISYTVSASGITETRTATITADFSDNVILNADGGEIEVITDSSTKVLPRGDYVAVLIGGASAGCSGGGGNINTARSTATGGAGGCGGASGNVTKVYFSANGTDSYSFVVGKGGVQQSQTAYRSQSTGSSVILIRTTETPAYGDTSLNGGTTTVSRNDTVIASATGGIVEQRLEQIYSSLSKWGCSGGNAGGIGAKGAHATTSGTTVGLGGQGGAKSGGNSVRTYYNAESLKSYRYVFEGATNTEKTYDTNYQDYSSSASLPGLKGKGCSSLLSQITTVEDLDNISVQDFLDNMSGGGSGTGGPCTFTSSYAAATCGGPGGGGGSWTDGDDGYVYGTSLFPVEANPWNSGKGGDGVILLACLGWTS